MGACCNKNSYDEASSGNLMLKEDKAFDNTENKLLSQTDSGLNSNDQSEDTQCMANVRKVAPPITITNVTSV